MKVLPWECADFQSLILLVVINLFSTKIRASLSCSMGKFITIGSCKRNFKIEGTISRQTAIPRPLFMSTRSMVTSVLSTYVVCSLSLSGTGSDNVCLLQGIVLARNHSTTIG